MFLVDNRRFFLLFAKWSLLKLFCLFLAGANCRVVVRLGSMVTEQSYVMRKTSSTVPSFVLAMLVAFRRRQCVCRSGLKIRFFACRHYEYLLWRRSSSLLSSKPSDALCRLRVRISPECKIGRKAGCRELAQHDGGRDL